MKRALKRMALASITRALAGDDGLVTLPVLRGPARGLRFRFDLSAFIEPAYVLGTYETSEVRAVARLCRPHWTVWDCGIYLGFYTALFAKLAKEVVAFEPDPRNIKRTRENLALNRLSNVRFVEVAIGAPDCQVDFVISGNTNSHVHGAFIGRDRSDYAERERRDSILRVPSMSLDEAVTKVPAPDLVKLDIEGSEGEALRYTETLCRVVRPLIIVELHNPECDRAAWEFSRRANYRLTSLDTGRAIRRAEDVHGTLLCEPQAD